MGKTIIQQARGHGSLSYRVPKKAFVYRIGYLPVTQEQEEAVVEKLLHSTGHSAPLAKIKLEKENKHFYIPAFYGAYEGQKIVINGDKTDNGNISALEKIPSGAKVFNIEINPGDGGKLIRTAGSFAIIAGKTAKEAKIILPSKKEKSFDLRCRATIGIIAAEGKNKKPFVKAGNKFYHMKSRNKLWPRTSAVKMNIIDHPFGSGRGKRIKSKIAKRNAPAGARVGLLRPKRTGRKKK